MKHIINAMRIVFFCVILRANKNNSKQKNLFSDGKKSSL